MKHIVIAVLIGAIALTSFGKKEVKWKIVPSTDNLISIKNDKSQPSAFQKCLNKKVWPWYYWTYLGENHNYFQQADPYYYEQTSSPFPACFNTMGHTVCSIRAMGDAWIEGIPDMNTIISRWYRPL